MSREDRREEFSSVSSSSVLGFGLAAVVGEDEEEEDLWRDATEKRERISKDEETREDDVYDLRRQKGLVWCAEVI